VLVEQNEFEEELCELSNSENFVNNGLFMSYLSKAIFK